MSDFDQFCGATRALSKASKGQGYRPWTLDAERPLSAMGMGACVETF